MAGDDAIFLLASYPALGILHPLILLHIVDAVVEPMHLPSALLSSLLALLHHLFTLPLLPQLFFRGNSFSSDHGPLIIRL